MLSTNLSHFEFLFASFDRKFEVYYDSGMKWSFLRSIFVCLSFATVSISSCCFKFFVRVYRFITVWFVVMADNEGRLNIDQKYPFGPRIFQCKWINVLKITVKRSSNCCEYNRSGIGFE